MALLKEKTPQQLQDGCFAGKVCEIFVKTAEILSCCVYNYDIMYFFGYKTEFFSFQNNLKNLDPSYEMDLELWDCLGRIKLVL